MPCSNPRLARCEIGELPLVYGAQRTLQSHATLADELTAFMEFGQPTRLIVTRFQTPDGETHEVPTFVNEFWTARQRQANSLHEISYRACFKPQLPRFFIERLAKPGNIREYVLNENWLTPQISQAKRNHAHQTHTC